MKVYLLILSIFMASCATSPEVVKPNDSEAWKSQVNFTASVDKESIEVGETFELTLTWTKSVKVEGGPFEPQLPVLKDFDLLSEWTHTGNGFYIDDYLHWTNTDRYDFTAQKIGSFVVDPAEITINGETFKTKPISIVVTQDKYADFLKTNKCEKQYWSRYELAEFFQTKADRNKLTPYDLVTGDSYTRRGVSAADQLGAQTRYINYLTEMPEPINKKFNQRFRGNGKNTSDNDTIKNYESKEKQTKNQRVVFNNSVKRDYECYLKLK